MSNVTHINSKQASDFLRQAIETLSQCDSSVFSYDVKKVAIKQVETVKQGESS